MVSIGSPTSERDNQLEQWTSMGTAAQHLLGDNVAEALLTALAEPPGFGDSLVLDSVLQGAAAAEEAHTGEEAALRRERLERRDSMQLDDATVLAYPASCRPASSLLSARNRLCYNLYFVTDIYI